MGVYLEYILCSFPLKNHAGKKAIFLHGKNSSLELLFSINKSCFCQPDSSCLLAGSFSWFHPDLTSQSHLIMGRGINQLQKFWQLGLYLFQRAPVPVLGPGLPRSPQLFCAWFFKVCPELFSFSGPVFLRENLLLSIITRNYYYYYYQ